MPRPKTPALTADCVVTDPRQRLLLIRRKNPPFKGMYALPGGFVDVGETVEDACRRELMEETGVRAGKLELLGVYSDPHRDPRVHTCSVVFMTRVRRATVQGRRRCGGCRVGRGLVQPEPCVRSCKDRGGRAPCPSQAIGTEFDAKL